MLPAGGQDQLTKRPSSSSIAPAGRHLPFVISPYPPTSSTSSSSAVANFQTILGGKKSVSAGSDDPLGYADNFRHGVRRLSTSADYGAAVQPTAPAPAVAARPANDSAINHVGVQSPRLGFQPYRPGSLDEPQSSQRRAAASALSSAFPAAAGLQGTADLDAASQRTFSRPFDVTSNPPFTIPGYRMEKSMELLLERYPLSGGSGMFPFLPPGLLGSAGASGAAAAAALHPLFGIPTVLRTPADLVAQQYLSALAAAAAAAAAAQTTTTSSNVNDQPPVIRSSNDDRSREQPGHAAAAEQNTDRDADAANRVRQTHHRHPHHHQHHHQHQHSHQHQTQQHQQQQLSRDRRRDTRQDADRRRLERLEVPPRSTDSWPRFNSPVDGYLGTGSNGDRSKLPRVLGGSNTSTASSVKPSCLSGELRAWTSQALRAAGSKDSDALYHKVQSDRERSVRSKEQVGVETHKFADLQATVPVHLQNGRRLPPVPDGVHAYHRPFENGAAAPPSRLDWRNSAAFQTPAAADRPTSKTGSSPCAASRTRRPESKPTANHVPKLSAHASNDRLTQTANSWATAVDFSTSGVVSLPQPLPPTSGSGRQTLRVHETAINYSMPRRTASAADGLPKTGNGIPTSKRPRPDADDDSDGGYMSRDRVSRMDVAERRLRQARYTRKTTHDEETAYEIIEREERAAERRCQTLLLIDNGPPLKPDLSSDKMDFLAAFGLTANSVAEGVSFEQKRKRRRLYRERSVSPVDLVEEPSLPTLSPWSPASLLDWKPSSDRIDDSDHLSRSFDDAQQRSKIRFLRLLGLQQFPRPSRTVAGQDLAHDDRACSVVSTNQQPALSPQQQPTDLSFSAPSSKPHQRRDCELDRPVIGGNIIGGGNVAGGDAWPTSSGLDDGCYERQLPKRNSSGDVERATNCRPSGVPRWPGVDTLIVACQRYVQGQRLEQAVLSEHCRRICSNNMELGRQAEALNNRLSELVRTKVSLDLERMNLQASSESLKRCLKSLRS